MLLAADGDVNGAIVELALPRSSIAGDAESIASSTAPLSERVANLEREAILLELKRQHYHITNTARALGLERSHFYKKCQQLGITLRSARGDAGAVG